MRAGGAAAFCLLVLGPISTFAASPQEQWEATQAAYRALKSFSCEVAVTTSADAPDIPPFRAQIALKFPDRAVIKITDGEIAFRVIGGPAGRQTLPLTGSVAAEKETKPATLTDSFQAAHLESTLLAQLLANSPAFSAENAGADTSETTVDGVPTRRWTGRRKTESGTEAIMLEIGAKDNLLRRATVTIGEGATAFRRTETYTAVQANPDLPDVIFAFPKVSPKSVASKGEAKKAAMPEEQSSQSFDSGAISPLDSPEITHDFPLKNISDKPLVLRRLVSSCGCATSVVAPPDTPAPAPDTASNSLDRMALARIPPGAETTIRVRIRTVGLPAGEMTKSVSVIAEGSPLPIARLEMKGKLSPVVTLPPILDFGKVAAGQSVSREISVSVNARLTTADNPPPTLIASNPLLKIVYRGKNDAPPFLLYRYQVTLPANAPLGPLRETLTLKPATISEEYKAFWAQAVSSVSGQVDGDVTADPPILAMGSLTLNENAVRTIKVTYKGGKPVPGRKIAVNSPNVSVVPGKVAGASEPLTITVKPNVIGALKTSVQVTLPNGQRLLIPITGYTFTVRKSDAPENGAPVNKP